MTDRDTPIADDDDDDSDSNNNKKITSTIEEIAPDDTTRTKESDVVVDDSNPKTCLNCGFTSINIKACLTQCPNCGSVRDCSDGI